MAGLACLSANISSCVSICRSDDTSNDCKDATAYIGCHDFDIILSVLRLILSGAYAIFAYGSNNKNHRIFYCYQSLVNLAFGFSTFIIFIILDIVLFYCCKPNLTIYLRKIQQRNIVRKINGRTKNPENGKVLKMNYTSN